MMMPAQTITSDGVIYRDVGNGKIATIDVLDMVDVPVAVLTGSSHEGKSQLSRISITKGVFCLIFLKTIPKKE